MEDTDTMDIFKVLWDRKLAIIVITAIFVIVGSVYTMRFVKPVYTSSTTLVLATSNSGNARSTTVTDDSITTTDLTINSKLVSTYSELVKSKNVLRKVISNLKLDINEEEIRENTQVNAVKNTELIEISVTNSNPYLAEKLANEIAKVFISMVEDIYKIENIHIVDVAEVPDIPSNINHKKDMIMFAVAGLLVGLLYAFVRSMLDTTVKTAEEIERMYQLPVLASMPIYNGSSNELKKRG